jgi:hypothetical protein
VGLLQAFFFGKENYLVNIYCTQKHKQKYTIYTLLTKHHAECAWPGPEVGTFCVIKGDQASRDGLWASCTNTGDLWEWE